MNCISVPCPFLEYVDFLMTNFEGCFHSVFLTLAYLCKSIYLHVFILLFHLGARIVQRSKVIKDFEFLHIIVQMYLPLEEETKTQSYSGELYLLLM